MITLKMTLNECPHCKTEYEIEAFLCYECFLKAMNKYEKKQKSKWRTIKRYTYCFMVTSIPLLIVSMKFGNLIQTICLGFFILGMFCSHIIDWLMEKF